MQHRATAISDYYSDLATQIIIAILSLYTIKSMPGLAIKTHCLKTSVDSLQVTFD